jgi:hypothetical protein
MICDVADGLDVVTFLDLIPRNVTGPINHPLVDPPPGWRGSLPGYTRTRFEAHVVGSWHDLAPGETRVQLDYTGLITFYDPTLSSLVEARQGRADYIIAWKEFQQWTLRVSMQSCNLC